MAMMLRGGVKESTENQYIKHFLEYWRTMRRLGINDVQIFQFPMDPFLLQVYIIDCAIVRAKPNCYTTIRNKLRAGDLVVEWSGYEQSWPTHPKLHAIMDYCKAHNKGKGSDTIAITVEKIRIIIVYIEIQIK